MKPEEQRAKKPQSYKRLNGYDFAKKIKIAKPKSPNLYFKTNP